MGQLFVLVEVLRILLLAMLVKVRKGLLKGSSGFKDRYDVINVGKGSRPDGCFCRRMVGSVRHVCLDDIAVVKVEEGVYAWASGCSTYIPNSPWLSTTPIVRRDIGSLVTAGRRNTLHVGEATQIRISYQERRQVVVDKAARRKTTEAEWSY